MKNSFFITPGEVARRLGCRVPQLLVIQSPFPYAQVAAPKRCYPLDYYVELAKYLDQIRGGLGRRFNVPRASWAFWEQQGRPLIESVQSDFKQRLKSKRIYSRGDIARLMGVDRTSVVRWQRKGALELDDHHKITREALAPAITWYLPN